MTPEEKAFVYLDFYAQYIQQGYSAKDSVTMAIDRINLLKNIGN